jgi:hypothetical protein
MSFGGKGQIFFLGITGTCACENESPLQGCQNIASKCSAQGPSSESCDSFDSALQGRTMPDASGGGGFHSTWTSRADMCASCSSQCGSCDSQLSGIRLSSDDGAERRHRCDQAANRLTIATRLCTASTCQAAVERGEYTRSGGS